MTIKHMAQTALDVQNACNLSGVAQSFAAITSAMRIEHGFDTPTCNTHPVCRLFAEQIAYLTNAGVCDTHTYVRAYEACEALARAES